MSCLIRMKFLWTMKIQKQLFLRENNADAAVLETGKDEELW